MKISELDNIEFDGYVWLSNKNKPKTLKGDKFEFSKYEEESNPFIIEALLFDKKSYDSIIVKHTGKYVMSKISLSELPENSQLEDVSYLPHRLKDVNRVCFKQLWVPEEDTNCEGMKVLKMKALVFVGFDCKTQKK